MPLKKVPQEAWIVRAYESAIFQMALSKKGLPERLSEAVVDILWQEKVLSEIPPSCKDHMHIWIYRYLDINLWDGESFMKITPEEIRERLMYISDNEAFEAINHLCQATEKMRFALENGGYEVPANA